MALLSRPSKELPLWGTQMAGPLVTLLVYLAHFVLASNIIFDFLLYFSLNLVWLITIVRFTWWRKSGWRYQYIWYNAIWELICAVIITASRRRIGTAELLMPSHFCPQTPQEKQYFVESIMPLEEEEFSMPLEEIYMDLQQESLV